MMILCVYDKIINIKRSKNGFDMHLKKKKENYFGGIFVCRYRRESYDGSYYRRSS